MKKQITLLPILIFAAISCSYLKPEQKIPSEAADTNAVETISASKLTLNRKSFGSLSNLNPLAQEISEIIKVRKANDVFKRDSTEIENSIFLEISPKLSIGKTAELANAINENGGKAYFPRKTADSTRKYFFIRPNPLFLVVKSEEISTELTVQSLPYEADADEYGFAPDFRFVEDRKELKAARVLGTSMEIAADDKYFINEGSKSELDSDPEYIDEKQRALPVSELKSELPKVASEGSKITIIASENASYASLLQIFRLAEQMKIDFHILVRRNEIPKRWFQTEYLI